MFFCVYYFREKMFGSSDFFVKRVTDEALTQSKADFFLKNPDFLCFEICSLIPHAEKVLQLKTYFQ